MPSLYRIKAQSAPAIWLLSTLLLFAPLGAHATGAVICIEADGEVAIERAEGAMCAEGVGERVPPGTSHCDVCTDVPLPSGSDTDCTSFKTERGPSAQTVLSVAAVLPMLDHVPVQPPTAASPHSGEGHPLSDPAPLRSVVLQL